jgi:hypothetical protein
MSFMDRDLVPESATREPRRARLIRATLRLADGSTMAIVVRNLSERGIGVTCKGATPFPGSTVHITMPGSPELQGIVRWAREGAFGIELTGSVDAQTLEEAVQRELHRQQEASGWKVSTMHRVNTPRPTNLRRLI